MYLHRQTGQAIVYARQCRGVSERAAHVGVHAFRRGTLAYSEWCVGHAPYPPPQASRHTPLVLTRAAPLCSGVTSCRREPPWPHSLPQHEGYSATNFSCCAHDACPFVRRKVLVVRRRRRLRITAAATALEAPTVERRACHAAVLHVKGALKPREHCSTLDNEDYKYHTHVRPWCGTCGRAARHVAQPCRECLRACALRALRRYSRETALNELLHAACCNCCRCMARGVAWCQRQCMHLSPSS